MKRTSSTPRTESPSRWSLSRATLRVEDIIIFGWLAILQPFTIGNHTRPIEELGQQGTVWGIAYLVAAGAAVICLASRDPAAPTFGSTMDASPYSIAPLPFVLAMSLLAGFGMQDLGVGRAEFTFLPALAVTVAALLFYRQLPTLPTMARRLSVIPIALVGSATFNGLMFEIFSQIDRSTIVQTGLGLLIFLVVLSGCFYAIFIYSPSQIADPKGSWTDWGVRYALFVAASLVGISVLGATR